MNFESFHQRIENDCIKHEETVIRIENGLTLLDEIGYNSSKSSKLKDLKSFKDMTSFEIHLLYQETYYFVPMEADGDDHDQENSRQTLMDLHRTAGLSGSIRKLTRVGKKRGLI